MTIEAPVAPVAPAPAEQPTLLAGKFKTPADLEAGYKALEAKLGAPKVPPSTEPATSLQIPDAPAAPKPTTVEAILQTAGLEPAALAATFATDGKLSAEQYAALEKVGYHQPAVDAFLRGQQAEAKLGAMNAQQVRADAMKIVGGEEQFAHLAEWARVNCTQQERDTFNSMVDGEKATPETVRMAMAWLNDRHGSATGRVQGSGMPTTMGAAPQLAAFGSQHEMVAAMKDPRYDPVFSNGSRNPKHDPAWFADVNRRTLAMKS